MNETTRDRILTSAIELWASRGYDSTGLREIAELCGIRQPSLYHHFDSKAELLYAAVGPYLESARAFVHDLARRPRTDEERRAAMAEWIWLQLEHRGATDVLAANPQLAGLLMDRFPGTGAVDLGPAASDWLVGADADDRARLRALAALKILTVDYVVKVSYDHMPRADLVGELVAAADAVLPPAGLGLTR